MDRREFLGAAAKTVVALGLANTITSRAEGAMPNGAEKKQGLKKALILSMLPGNLSLEERFALAKNLGFEGIEVEPTTDAARIKEFRAASEKTGVAIHSILLGGWGHPLSSGDQSISDAGLEELKAGLQCAREMKADSLLLVPAMVNAETSYQDAYARSQKQIRKAIPLAEKLGVVIAVENVWNNFLLSPLEFARYVDELKSPMVRAYFDVGNVVAFGWPEQWIRTLGKRIHRIHLKDFKREGRLWTNLGDGDVDWPKVRTALAEVGYTGYVTAELGGGDEGYLRDISQRIGRLVTAQE